MIQSKSIQLDIVRGQALEVAIPVTDTDGDPVDLGAATIEAGIAPNPSSAWTVEPVTSVEDDSTIIVALSAENTASLVAGRAFMSVWVTINNDPSPVSRAYVRVQDDPINYED